MGKSTISTGQFSIAMLVYQRVTGWWCNNNLEKYEFVIGKDDIPYMKWKVIKFMFQTTRSPDK
jgi:hypothetical protein